MNYFLLLMLVSFGIVLLGLIIWILLSKDDEDDNDSSGGKPLPLDQQTIIITTLM